MFSSVFFILILLFLFSFSFVHLHDLLLSRPWKFSKPLLTIHEANHNKNKAKLLRYSPVYVDNLHGMTRSCI